MDMLSIRIQIGGREYPMRVSREEEQLLRRGAKALDLEIKRCARAHKIHDYRDMLAMVAFDLMVEKVRQGEVLADQAQDSLSWMRRIQKILSSSSHTPKV